MITLWTGRCVSASFQPEYTRDARLNEFGPVNSIQLSSVLALAASCSALAPIVVSWMASSRSTGSSRSVASDVNMMETWLPSPLFSVRTDTGIAAISGCLGTPPWSVR